MKCTFYGGPYKECITVFVSSWATAARYIESKGFDTGKLGKAKLAKTVELETDSGKHEIVIWLPEHWTYKNPTGAGALAHECLHATIFIMKQRGCADSTVLDEPGNYYLEHLVYLICAWFDKQKKRTKKR